MARPQQKRVTLGGAYEASGTAGEWADKRSHTPLSFDIRFVGHSWHDSDSGESLMLGELRIADVTERFAAVMGPWDARDYQRQWLEGIERLLNGATRSALVVSISPRQASDYRQWLPMWREGQTVYLQVQFMDWTAGDLKDDPAKLYDAIGLLVRENEEGDQYATHETSVDELRRFVKQCSP